jgi:hypothetical protein
MNNGIRIWKYILKIGRKKLIKYKKEADFIKSASFLYHYNIKNP